MKHLIIVRGGGELGTATAHRLHRVGYKVLILEKARPSALRREISFSDAVYDGEKTVERVTCVCAENLKTALSLISKGKVTMLVDPTGRYVRKFPPHILVNSLDGKEDESRRELPADFSHRPRGGVLRAGGCQLRHRDRPELRPGPNYLQRPLPPLADREGRHRRRRLHPGGNGGHFQNSPYHFPNLPGGGHDRRDL